MLTKHSPKWTTRLNPSTGYSPKCHNYGSYSDEMTLSFEAESGHEYELDVTVFVEFEDEQNGGWDDPSWDAHYYAPVAVWHRDGHGYKVLDLSSSQERQILEHFSGNGEGYIPRRNRRRYY